MPMVERCVDVHPQEFTPTEEEVRCNGHVLVLTKTPDQLFDSDLIGRETLKASDEPIVVFPQRVSKDGKIIDSGVHLLISADPQRPSSLLTCAPDGTIEELLLQPGKTYAVGRLATGLPSFSGKEVKVFRPIAYLTTIDGEVQRSDDTDSARRERPEWPIASPSY